MVLFTNSIFDALFLRHIHPRQKKKRHKNATAEWKMEEPKNTKNKHIENRLVHKHLNAMPLFEWAKCETEQEIEIGDGTPGETGRTTDIKPTEYWNWKYKYTKIPKSTIYKKKK